MPLLVKQAKEVLLVKDAAVNNPNSFIFSVKEKEDLISGSIKFEVHKESAEGETSKKRLRPGLNWTSTVTPSDK